MVTLKFLTDEMGELGAGGRYYKALNDGVEALENLWCQSMLRQGHDRIYFHFKRLSSQRAPYVC